MAWANSYVDELRAENKMLKELLKHFEGVPRTDDRESTLKAIKKELEAWDEGCDDDFEVYLVDQGWRKSK
jgi:hypothetical protein